MNIPVIPFSPSCAMPRPNSFKPTTKVVAVPALTSPPFFASTAIPVIIVAPPPLIIISLLPFVLYYHKNRF